MNTSALLIFCLLLIPCAHGSVALISQGLGRSRSAAHTVLTGICAMAVAAIAFALCGAKFDGFAGGAHRVLVIGTTSWNWIGTSLPPAEAFGFNVLVVSLATMIPVSTGSDRLRILPVCLATVPMAALILPLYMHAVWSGGWLAEGICARDMGGAGVVQCVGGLSALSLAWLAGPRAGKYYRDRTEAIPGHNIVLALCGCFLALVGWQAIEVACGLLFYGASTQQLAWVPVYSLLAASAGLLASVLHTQLRYQKIDASMAVNAWTAGLIAQSAVSYQTTLAGAVLVGAVGGALTPWLIEWLELGLRIDDPGGAIATHLGGGLCGLLLGGPLGRDGTALTHRMTAVSMMIATLLGIVFPLLHGGNWLLNRITRFRVNIDGETHGMDICELGSAAYPEFVVHAQDLYPH